MPRKFKIARVTEVIESFYYSPFQWGKNAVNRVRGDCGHIITTTYFGKDHYKKGDRIRCYECGIENFQGMDADSIEAELDTMFPGEDNTA